MYTHIDEMKLMSKWIIELEKEMTLANDDNKIIIFNKIKNIRKAKRNMKKRNEETYPNKLYINQKKREVIILKYKKIE
jgi:hypothetical protein